MRRRLADPAVHTVAIQLFGAFAAFVVYVVTTRSFGAQPAGRYAFFVQTVVAGSTVALFGYDQKAMRSIARAHSLGSLSHATPYLRQLAIRFALTTMVVIAVVAVATLALRIDDVDVASMWLVAPAIICYGSLRFSTSAIRGDGAIRTSQALVSLPPMIMLPMLAALVVQRRGDLPDVSVAMLLYVVSIVGPLILGVVVLRRRMQRWRASERAMTSAPLDDRNHALGLAVLVPTVATWLSFAAIASAIGSADVAAYQACILLTTPINMARTTYLNAVAPRLAGTLAARDHEQTIALQRDHRRVLLGFGAPPLLLLSLLADPVLTLFDESLTDASAALRVFAAGMLINLVFGSASTALLMAGQDRAFLSITLQALALWAAVLVTTISSLGLIGVAIAYALQILYTQAAAQRSLSVGSPERSEDNA